MELNADSVTLGEAAIWRDTEELECCSVVPEAPNVMTFSFVSPSRSWFRYNPGQFLTLELPVAGGVIWRTYTISSSPSRPLSISVTVKAQKGSIGTRWMLDSLQPGMKLRAKGPSGIFTLSPKPNSKYLFISAGAGITPTMSMLTYLFDRGIGTDIVLVNCARRPSEIICRRRLEQMAARVPSIKLHFIVAKDDPYDVWSGYRGHFNQIMLGLIANDYLDREIYCCGPETFMQSVRDILHTLGFDMAKYFQESFDAPIETKADLPKLNDVVPDEAIKAELIFAMSGITATCAETDTVLAAAKSSGLNISSGCNFGVCGTCKIRKIRGEVHMVHNGGISEDDIEAGYILACCSHPIGQVEVEV